MHKKKPAPRLKSHSKYPTRASEYKTIEHFLFTPCRSSLTVEAALALTLVILASTVLMTPMLILNHQRNASQQLEANARLLAKEKYVEYYQTEKGNLTLDPDRLGRGEAALAAAALGQQIAQPGMKGIDLFTASKITQDTITYIANYDAVLPFSVLGVKSLRQQVVASRRAWIGAPGNRWADAGSDTSEDDPTVYISVRDDASAYHTTISCSYLSHDIQSARGEDMLTMKNSFGSRYRPCASCRPGLSSETVYYTLTARSYHTKPNCNTISSHIESLPKSTAVAYGRHPCVRCGKGS